VTCRLKAGIVEPEEPYIARQVLGKHVSATTYNNGTVVERRCFLCGPPRSYITRITGQLELELRESLELAVAGESWIESSGVSSWQMIE
jgi:hypothetical protein